jgi:pimeloyl-ACP methyl ester carboxylesterase
VPVLAGKYRVVRFDVRGCGEHNPLPPKGAEWSAERLAKDALNLIDHLGIRRVHWAGFESGGVWGMVFAANHPDRIASLTLCNTPSSAWFDQDLGKVTIPDFVETNPVRLGQLMANPVLVEWHTTEQSKTPAEVAIAIRHIQDTADMSGMPGKVKVPVLILNGDRSRQCALDQQYEFQRAFPNARMVVFPNMTDGLQLQIPVRCAEELLKLVQSL